MRFTFAQLNILAEAEAFLHKVSRFNDDPANQLTGDFAQDHLIIFNAFHESQSGDQASAVQWFIDNYETLRQYVARGLVEEQPSTLGTQQFTAFKPKDSEGEGDGSYSETVLAKKEDAKVWQVIWADGRGVQHFDNEAAADKFHSARQDSEDPKLTDRPSGARVHSAWPY